MVIAAERFSLAISVEPQDIPEITHEAEPESSYVPYLSFLQPDVEERVRLKQPTSADNLVLMRLAKSSDDGIANLAFTALVYAHTDRMRFYLIRKFNFDPIEAEVGALEVMSKAWEKKEQFDTEEGDCNVRAWLYRITHNFGIDSARERSYKTRKLGREHSMERLREFGIQERSLEDVNDLQLMAERAERRDFVQQVLSFGILNDSQIEILTHRFLGDKSITETAETMGTTRAGAKSEQMRAKRAFLQTCAVLLPKDEFPEEYRGVYEEYRRIGLEKLANRAKRLGCKAIRDIDRAIVRYEKDERAAEAKKKKSEQEAREKPDKTLTETERLLGKATNALAKTWRLILLARSEREQALMPQS